MITTILVLATLANDNVEMKFVPSGAVERARGYRPIQAKMATKKPGSVKKLPTNLKAPRFGEMTLAGTKVGFVLDGNKLFVDANRDGDFTNDPAVKWDSNNSVTLGITKVDIGRGADATVTLYHFNESDPNRASMKDIMFYYGDYGYEIKLTLDGKSLTSFAAGDITLQTSLWIDRNGDAKQSYFHEYVKIGAPFNFTGTTYLLSLVGTQLKLAKADTAVPMEPMPPTLTVGARALPFNSALLDGSTVSFPSSYKGKIVLLDFWATWCGPCMGEVPNVVKNYKKYHSQGFEILGISFDESNSADKVKSVTKEKGMTWPQVYEGKGWDTAVGKMYDVASIPFTLLIDGDTGEIIATVDALRGEILDKTLAKALAAKHKTQR